MISFDDRLDDFHKGIISEDVYSRLRGKKIGALSNAIQMMDEVE